jgi:hypothetical protein
MPAIKRQRSDAVAACKKVARTEELDDADSSVQTVAHQRHSAVSAVPGTASAASSAEPQEVGSKRNADGSCTLTGAAATKALEHVGEQDPGVFLEWDTSCLVAAVAHANATQPAFPAWMPPGAAYPLHFAQLQQAVVLHLNQFAGGLVGQSLLAPNSLAQCLAIWARMSLMMTDPFMHAICGGAGQFPLARIFVMADNQRQTTGVSMPPQVPAGVLFPAFA